MLNFKDYKTNSDGNVAMMFAVSTVMLLTGIGAAIDFSNMSRAKGMLQAQVDAAVLAAALVEVDSDDSEAEQKQIRIDAANQVIMANGYDESDVTPEIVVSDSTVTLTAKVNYKPSFGGILGIDSIPLSAVAESGLPGQQGFTIALVVDNTNSMSVDDKMQALEDGAISLIEAIEESGSDSQISLVPFSRYVKLDQSYRSASWLDVPAEYDTPRTYQQGTNTGGTCITETRTRDRDGVTQEYETDVCTGQTTTYEEKTTVLESRWDGCVGTRPPPYNETDDSYTKKIPGLLNRVPKEVSGLTWDVRTWCPSEIIPLTDDYDKLKSEVRGLYTTDNTYLPIGLSWGQRVLSPGEPFDNDADTRKIMVLMTDGNNTTEIMQDAVSVSKLESPPYIASVDDDETAALADATTTRMCENIKASGIEIYTIAFKVTDPTTKTLLRNCASSPSMALTAESNQSLVNTFKQVANELEADIRLMR